MHAPLICLPVCREDHYLCDELDCRDCFVAFATPEELEMHRQVVHMRPRSLRHPNALDFFSPPAGFNLPRAPRASLDLSRYFWTWQSSTCLHISHSQHNAPMATFPPSSSSQHVSISSICGSHGFNLAQLLFSYKGLSAWTGPR